MKTIFINSSYVTSHKDFYWILEILITGKSLGATHVLDTTGCIELHENEWCNQMGEPIDIDKDKESIDDFALRIKEEFAKTFDINSLAQEIINAGK